jgi:TRAP-type C4-dicarboxylate transport system substrate-binding protein
MCNKFKIKKLFIAGRVLLYLVLIFFILSLSSIFSTAAEKNITLKAVSAWPQNNRMNDVFWTLQKTVKEKSKGRLEIIWGGGPEAIPSFQQVEALRNGVIDLGWNAHTYCVAQIPIAEAAKLSKLTPWQEREKGVHDFFQSAYQKKLNAYYLGRGTPGLTYNLYTTEPVRQLSDFKGMRIRVTAAHKALVEGLGASPVALDPSEIYTALERKLIKGLGWPSVGTRDFGWDEVYKFVIDPTFFEVDVFAAVHINAWNRLPKDLQEVLNLSMQEAERWAYAHFKSQIGEEREKLKQKGVQVIKLPGEEANKYLQIAYGEHWKEVLKKEPQSGAQLYDLMNK